MSSKFKFTSSFLWISPQFWSICHISSFFWISSFYKPTCIFRSPNFLSSSSRTTEIKARFSSWQVGLVCQRKKTNLASGRAPSSPATASTAALAPFRLRHRSRDRNSPWPFPSLSLPPSRAPSCHAPCGCHPTMHSVPPTSCENDLLTLRHLDRKLHAEEYCIIIFRATAMHWHFSLPLQMFVLSKRNVFASLIHGPKIILEKTEGKF